MSSLNAVMEASRIGPEAKRLTEMNTELHRKIQKLRKSLMAGGEAVRKLEVSLEPCVTDSDQAFHAFDGLGEVAAEMQGHIKLTTEALMSQAKTVEKLNEDFGGGPLLSSAPRVEAPGPVLAPVAASIPAPSHSRKRAKKAAA